MSVMKQMRAWRKDGNGYKEVMVNVDPVNNIPLLPPNTTTDPMPEAHSNMFLTVRDNYWIYLPKNPVKPEEPIDSLALTRGAIKSNFDKWKATYVDAPFYHDGFVLHNDLIARTNILGAYVAFKFHKRIPPKWKAMGNRILDPSAVWLERVSLLSVHYYESRLFLSEVTAMKIAGAKTVEELQSITFPQIPNLENLMITGPAEDESLRPLWDEQGNTDVDEEEIDETPVVDVPVNEDETDEEVPETEIDPPGEEVIEEEEEVTEEIPVTEIIPPVEDEIIEEEVVEEVPVDEDTPPSEEKTEE